MRIPCQTRPLCSTCTSRFLSLFLHGFPSLPKLTRNGGKPWMQHSFSRVPCQIRRFTSNNLLKTAIEPNAPQGGHVAGTPAQMEGIARQARQTFGETLPAGFLSAEEYQIYERLYGPPSRATTQEDIDFLLGTEREEESGVEVAKNTLMRENESGQLEEIAFEEEVEDEVEGDQEVGEDVEDFDGPAKAVMEKEFEGRIAVFRDIAASRAASRAAESRAQDEGAVEDADSTQEELDQEFVQEQYLDEEAEEDFEDGNAYESSDDSRTHPLTAEGRFGTSPATIYIPKGTVVDPIAAILADASNKQLKEVAERTFGGHALPNSTATPQQPHLKQQPVALEASQFKMGEMEANAYLAAMMPGAYASIMSTLVEVRKRLGSEWLRKLMRRREGPRVFDAGAGGAGVLAWREILRAEWEAMHPNGVPLDTPIPTGKSTVVTGSAALRHRASKLLDNTTFIPRLPDYDPSRDHPALEKNNPQPRKQYDIIIAPHTLWTLKEDYMRKNQIENFWSLLEPRGGVLVLLEKGIPRGFELIAAARETLLKHHLSPDPSEHPTSTRSGRPDDKGTIIAPCTNHTTCPMFIQSPKVKRRKDLCHFSQRYIRPAFLQRILGQTSRNHEDIKFSYLALQRGVDKCAEQNFTQGASATEAAFAGYENSIPHPSSSSTSPSNSTPLPVTSAPNPLSLPRTLLPPLKRHGHVILDLCTPAGKIERWTVPRSFSKQAYRDARKANWGDLWALGAKTRVDRKIRVGDVGGEEEEEGKGRSKKGKGKGKGKGRNKSVEEETMEEEEMEGLVERNGVGGIGGEEGRESRVRQGRYAGRAGKVMKRRQEKVGAKERVKKKKKEEKKERRGEVVEEGKE